MRGKEEESILLDGSGMPRLWRERVVDTFVVPANASVARMVH
jgi:hypothetical protein